MNRVQVAYILRCFPSLSETFVLNEIDTLGTAGMGITVYSLLRPQDVVVHRKARDWISKTIYADTLRRTTCLRAHAHFLRASPGRYLRLILHSREEGGLRVAATATCVAYDLAGRGIRHVHVHFAGLASYYARCVNLLTGIPYSCTLHAVDIWFQPPANLVDVILDSRFCATVSRFNREYLLNKYPQIAAGKIKVVYSGVDTEQFRPRKEREPGPLTVLFVGRFVREKRAVDIVHLCKRLHEEGHAVRCLMVGDGPERAAVQRQIMEQGLQEWVLLPGALPHEQLPDVYRKADVFLLTSESEGLPVVLMEAMASGLPVVAPNLTGIPELVDNAVSGFLYEGGNLNQAANAICRLANDERLRAQMGRSGRAKIEASFRLQDTVLRIASLMGAQYPGLQ